MFFFILFAIDSPGQTLLNTGASIDDLASLNATTASPDPLSASYRNPAGLSLNHAIIGVSLSFQSSWLKINNNSSNDTVLMEGVQFASPINVFGLKNRLFFGLTMVTPGLKIYRIRALPQQTPQMLFVREESKRLDLAASLGFKITDWLALGAGVTVEPEVNGDVTVDFTRQAKTSKTDVDVLLRPAVVLGLKVGQFKGLSLGIVYRQGNYTPLNIPVNVKVSDQIPEVRMIVKANDLFTPSMLDSALSYHYKTFDFYLDVGVLFFSSMKQPSPDVYLLDSKGNISSSTHNLSPGGRTVVVPAAAIKYRPDAWITLIGGYAFKPSVVKEQSDVTNLLDSPGHSIGLGMDMDFYKGFRIPIGVSVGVKTDIYMKQTDTKLVFVPDNPGYPHITYRAVDLIGGIGLWLRTQ